ncbi:MAG: hypothetical protein GKR97_05995 [Rhizobiaceae bacterium]|nr:hypothetical protein [Rhizobiaceae bacterium]
MKLGKTILGALALGAASLMTSTASAADIPCSTAKLIVPWAPGGGTHIIFSIFEGNYSATLFLLPLGATI